MLGRGNRLGGAVVEGLGRKGRGEEGREEEGEVGGGREEQQQRVRATPGGLE